MKIVTERDRIRSVLKRYNEQYPRGHPNDGYFNKEVTRKALAALDLETCSRADVDAILPKGWADLECDECDKVVERVIHFGMEPDYDARWWKVCPSCLKAASELLEKGTEK